MYSLLFDVIRQCLEVNVNCTNVLYTVSTKSNNVDDRARVHPFLRIRGDTGSP